MRYDDWKSTDPDQYPEGRYSAPEPDPLTCYRCGIQVHERERDELGVPLCMVCLAFIIGLRVAHMLVRAK